MAVPRGPSKRATEIRGQLDPRDEVTTAVERPRGLHDSMHQAERNGRSMFEASRRGQAHAQGCSTQGFLKTEGTAEDALCCCISYRVQSTSPGALGLIKGLVCPNTDLGAGRR